MYFRDFCYKYQKVLFLIGKQGYIILYKRPKKYSPFMRSSKSSLRYPYLRTPSLISYISSLISHRLYLFSTMNRSFDFTPFRSGWQTLSLTLHTPPPLSPTPWQSFILQEFRTR